VWRFYEGEGDGLPVGKEDRLTLDQSLVGPVLDTCLPQFAEFRRITGVNLF
jgi:hypothetical protein